MELIGHKKQKEHLNRALANGVVASSYIFSGPAHIGKRTLAEFFARAIIDGQQAIDFADGAERDYYGDLLTCAPITEVKKIAQKKGAKKKGGAKKLQEKNMTHDISVDQIREVVHELSLSSFHGQARVLIIDDADRMGRGAQNAFLKTVEEPPRNAYIIFVTSDISRLLPTMRSRAQTLSFGLMNEDALHGISSDTQLCAMAMGRPGLLKQLQNDAVVKEQYKNGHMQEQTVLEGSITQKIAIADDLSKDKEYARDVLTMMQWKIRQQTVQDGSYENFTKIMHIEKTRQLLRTNVNARMALEELFLHM